MAYRILLKRSAEKELAALPNQVHDRIVKKMLSLQEDPRPHGVKKLKGGNGYRVRVGDYRILFVIEDNVQTIEVFSVVNRKDAY